MNKKEKAILEKIKNHEDALTKGQEYLEEGKHEYWNGFDPLFDFKFRNGKFQPPHKDWVKSTFIPHHERALKKAYGALDRVTRAR